MHNISYIHTVPTFETIIIIKMKLFKIFYFQNLTQFFRTAKLEKVDHIDCQCQLKVNLQKNIYYFRHTLLKKNIYFVK